MSTKFKIISATLLTIALIFGGTLNFSEAASKSTTKIISDLKKEVKKLTTSNKTKDKEIAKLKKEIKIKDRSIYLKDRDFNNLMKNYDRVNKEIMKREENVEALWDLKFKYKRSISHYISDGMKENGKVKAYCQQNPDNYCNEDIRINSDEFYLSKMFNYITKQELKEITITQYKNWRDPWINAKNIIITTPDGDLVIPLSTNL